MEQMITFRIHGGDLYYIAKNMYKLSFSKLSPFYSLPEGGELSEEGKELAKDRVLREAVGILASPRLKLSLRRGGSHLPLEASTLFVGQETGSTAAVYLQEDGGLLSLTYLDSLEKYGRYFAAQNGAPVSEKPVKGLQGALTLESMIFIFNLTDCYRRAHLNNMLRYSAEPVDAIYEDEVVAVLEKELKSTDMRWLLPSFLRLVPGLDKTVLEFSSEQADAAEAMDFISRGANPGEKRPVYYLGASGKYMGLEFSLLWRYSAGFEISALNPVTGDEESLGRYYFAPTDEANHLFTIADSKDSGTTVVHETLTLEETAERVGKILREHCEGTSAPRKPAPVQAPARPAVNFCSQCGTKLSASDAFCGKCGSKVQ